jgi:archaemetzincin
MMPVPKEPPSLRLPVRAVTLVPIQPVDLASIEQISEALHLRGVSVQNRSSILRPRGSYDAHRRQLKADVLLERVAEIAERPALGITDADCYAGGLNFVFGIAHLYGGTAVVSLARLRTGASKATFTARAMKEIFHELGHAAGLKHCGQRGCVMGFSNSLADTDAKGEELCASCCRHVAR